MKTDILPLLVGLSLCGASATLLYIWYKTKDQEDTIHSPNVSPIKANQETKVECVISNNIVPLVVGRSGANVKSIEEKTNTKIRFREKDESNQICEITGLTENVKRAAELIKQEASPPPNITEEMFVPQSSCGKIIGRCGESLQEICRKSMAKVHVDAGDRSDGNTRRILITGTKAHVNIAKSLIEDKIRKDVEAKYKMDIETKREPRGSPRNNDETTSNSSEEMVPIESEKLILNKSDGQMEVYISAIASPSRFWLQLVGPQSLKLDKLVEDMTQYYSVIDNQKLHKIADPYLGQIVAAMFKYDGKWYRAEIVGILPNEYNPRDVVLDLYFVDFGDSEYVAPCEVFELRTDFLTLRFQAIECFLANVIPAKENSDIWEPDAISRFEELTYVAKWKKILSRVVTTRERKLNDPHKKESSSVPGVELFNNSDGSGINIAHQLITEGFAISELGTEHTNGRTNTNSLALENAATSNDSIPQITITPKNDTNETVEKIDTTPIVPVISSVPPPSAPTKVVPVIPVKSRLSANFTESDKFSAICENTTNENYENIKRDNRNNISSFMDAERRNGNGVVDNNSNNGREVNNHNTTISS